MAFTKKIPVRFDEVDFARVVYFPRLFGYCHQVFEDFFAEAVGISYAQMLQKRKIAYPSVHAEADFKHPLRFGDTVRISMETVKLSSKSITSRYRLYLNDTQMLCAEVEIITVPIDIDTFKARQVPEDVRVAFLNHLTGLTV
jgi:4-hydroxybenzoyl-CoA thioesterase